MYVVIYNDDAVSLKQRAPQFKNKKLKGHFASPGPNYVHSLDGHDKLMDFRNTFPIAIYGCIDTCKRRALWAKVWIGNSDPKLIGAFFLGHLFKTRMIASE